MHHHHQDDADPLGDVDPVETDFFLLSGLFVGRVVDRDWRLFADRRVVHFAYFYPPIASPVPRVECIITTRTMQIPLATSTQSRRPPAGRTS
jgi:hypothetical protein